MKYALSQKLCVFLSLFLLFFGANAFALSTSENAFRLEDSSQGNVLLGAEQAIIEAGEVYGTVVLLWGNLEVRGQVSEVVILSGKVTFTPESKLIKTLSVMGGEFESQPGAQVAPENVVYRSPGPLWRILQSSARVWSDNLGWMLKALAMVSFCGFLWVAGLLLFWLAPTIQGITAGRIFSQGAKNFVVAFLGTIAVPAFAGLLLISVLGIVLIPFYLLTLVIAGLISYLGAALWAGHRLLPPRAKESLNPWGFLLGIIAFQIFWVVGDWWAIAPVLLLWMLAWGSLLRGLRALWR